MIRISTQVRDEEILRLHNDGVHAKLIAQVLGLSSVWIVYRAVLRSKRPEHCPCCPNSQTVKDQNAKLCQNKI